MWREGRSEVVQEKGNGRVRVTESTLHSKKKEGNFGGEIDREAIGTFSTNMSLIIGFERTSFSTESDMKKKIGRMGRQVQMYGMLWYAMVFANAYGCGHWKWCNGGDSEEGCLPWGYPRLMAMNNEGNDEDSYAADPCEV